MQLTAAGTSRHRRPGRSWALVAGVLLVVTTAAPAARAATPASVAAAAYARMTTAQRVGQLFMVGAPVSGTTAAGRTLLATYHVGNTVLVGTTTGGVAAVRAVVAPLWRVATQAGVHPYVAVDQEGGTVQRLNGAGFSAVPTALRQGQLPVAALRADWTAWASQLRHAGVNLDLAPVADVVPGWIGTANQPIGRYDREYGYTVAVVAPHVGAAVQGLQAAGVGATVKHFPGLGRATGNTDTTRGVRDPTRRHDPYLAAFRSAITAGAPAVMVSTAVYPNIDPSTVGAFSHLVTTVVLRYDLGFTGLIVSDSLQAASVTGYSYASRAVRALDAGVDVLLLTTGAPVPAMTDAIRDRMRTSPEFSTVVKTAVLRVLTAKAKAGLIGP